MVSRGCVGERPSVCGQSGCVGERPGGCGQSGGVVVCLYMSQAYTYTHMRSLV